MEHERRRDLFVNNPNSRNVLIDIGFTKALLEMDHPTNIALIVIKMFRRGLRFFGNLSASSEMNID